MKEEKHLQSPAESARTITVLADKFSEKRLKDPRTNIRMNTVKYSKVNHPDPQEKGVSKHILKGYIGQDTNLFPKPSVERTRRN